MVLPKVYPYTARSQGNFLLEILLVVLCNSTGTKHNIPYDSYQLLFAIPIKIPTISVMVLL